MFYVTSFCFIDRAENDERCQMYDGVPCNEDPSLCCYNKDKWCPDGGDCSADNGAYPFGDVPIFPNQMTEAHALTPFPNAIVFNWATIFVLAFGNLAGKGFANASFVSLLILSRLYHSSPKNHV